MLGSSLLLPSETGFDAKSTLCFLGDAGVLPLWRRVLFVVHGLSLGLQPALDLLHRNV